MSGSKDGNPQKEARPTPVELAAMQRSFWPEDDMVDGYCEDDDDHDRDPSHHDRVLDAIGDFMKGKRKRHGC